MRNCAKFRAECLFTPPKWGLRKHACKTQGLLDQIHQIFIICRWVIGGVHGSSNFAIFPSVIECQHTE